MLIQSLRDQRAVVYKTTIVVYGRGLCITYIRSFLVGVLELTQPAVKRSTTTSVYNMLLLVEWHCSIVYQYVSELLQTEETLQDHIHTADY